MKLLKRMTGLIVLCGIAAASFADSQASAQDNGNRVDAKITIVQQKSQDGIGQIGLRWNETGLFNLGIYILFLAGIFLYSGYVKLQSTLQFAMTISGYQLVPARKLLKP